MAENPVDRNLLLGVKALHLGLIDRQTLMAALGEWLLDKTRSLGEVLVARGALADDQRAWIEPLVERHIAAHQGDVSRSLAAVSSWGSLHDDLSRLPDAELQASLAHVGAGETAPPASGRGQADVMTTPVSGRAERFRILKLQDRGGMGLVWVAQDTELPRHVAVKEIKPEYARDTGTRQRFQLEAEITGGLEHPGIVPVYGLGTFDDGRPFYVMRFVRGDSLKEAIARFHEADQNGRRDPGQRRLELRELLQRLIDVTNAIAYAHERGVLHRDLKPGNVMVGRHGETLVVDWGLARLIGSDDIANADKLQPPSASGSELTQQGPVGTLQYMSPEQAQCRPDLLGRASDIYGLGAILYVLLTGKPPRPNADRDDALAAAQRGDYLPLHLARPGIPPALAAICEKALHSQPERRYGTAEELASELKHWLADEPVTAYREPLVARLSRAARRHRTLVASAAAGLMVSVVGLSLGLVVLGAKNEQLRVARDAAEANAELAQRHARESRALIDEWFTGVSESRELREAPGLQPLRRKLLERAKTYYQQAATERGGRDVLLDAARASQRLGMIVMSIDDKRRALSHFEQSLAQCQQLADAYPNDTDIWRAQADAGSRLANALLDVGRTEEALAKYQDGLAIRQRLVALQPTLIDHQRDLAGDHYNLSRLLMFTGRGAEAIREGERGLQLRQQLSNRQPDEPAYARDVAASQRNLGVLYHREGRLAEAEQSYRAALVIWRQLLEQDPQQAELAQFASETGTNLGLLLAQTGRTEAALLEFHTARERLASLVRDNPSVHAYGSSLASCHTNLANLLDDLGRNEEALTSRQKSAEVMRRLATENPADTRYLAELSNSLNNLGMSLDRNGRRDEALAMYRDAAQLVRSGVQSHPQVTALREALATSYLNAGALLADAGRLREAIAEYELSRAIWERLIEENPGNIGFREAAAICRSNIASALDSEGAIGEALPHYQAAHELRERLALEHPQDMRCAVHAARGQALLAGALRRSGRIHEAVESYRLAVGAYEKLAAANPALVELQTALGETRVSLGETLERVDQLEESLAELKAGVAVLDHLVAEQPESLTLRSQAAAAQHELGVILGYQQRFEEGLRECDRALEVRQQLLDADPQSAAYRSAWATSQHDRSELLLGLGRFTEARVGFERAESTRTELASEQPDVNAHRLNLAASQWNLARCHFQEGNPVAALEWLDRALATFATVRVLYSGNMAQRAAALCLRGELAASAEGEHSREALHGEAVAWAARALDQGFPRRRLLAMQEIEPLRSRDDFQRLLATADEAMP